MAEGTELRSDRIVLRQARPHDREGMVEILTDPEARRHLGGPLPREEAERRVERIRPDAAAAIPGSLVIARKDTDAFLGTLLLESRLKDRPGHVLEAGGELELSYMLRRGAWGSGFAFEAANTLLRAAAETLADQPVLIVTQTANTRALQLALRLGFTISSTFEEFGAQQALAVADLHSFKASDPI